MNPKTFLIYLAKRSFLLLSCLLFPLISFSQKSGELKLRIAVARMTHDHIGFILNRLKNNDSDLKLAGIFEPNHELVEKYSKKYNLNPSLFYDNFNKMLDQSKPEAVLAFGSIFEHLEVVEACAPRGIHVMVEKPLAVNTEHANKMKALSDKYKTLLLTDFETSWYPSTAKSWQLINDSAYVGTLRKVVVHDGHEGPKEIGCSREFLAWLTDPVLNGGGAIIDFGCYGANLMTYLTKGQIPVSVTAVTRQFKPAIYPKVDDDATIIISYPSCECIIQASWNWPFSRKDMEIYGENGFIISDNKNDMRIKNRNHARELKIKATAGNVEINEDPFSYFANVIHGTVKMTNHNPYAIENNIMVVKILDAAIESAKTGTTVKYKL